MHLSMWASVPWAHGGSGPIFPQEHNSWVCLRRPFPWHPQGQALDRTNPALTGSSLVALAVGPLSRDCKYGSEWAVISLISGEFCQFGETWCRPFLRNGTSRSANVILKSLMIVFSVFSVYVCLCVCLCLHIYIYSEKPSIIEFFLFFFFLLF